MNDITHVDSGDNRPLPLIVAEKWNFKLAYTLENGVYWYTIQDWVAGLTSADFKVAARIIADMRRHEKLDMLDTIQQLPYTAKDGKKYKMDFTTDNGLYLIAQNLKAMKGRPLLAAIQKYLAEAGVLVDEVRRNTDAAIDAVIRDPDKAIETIIKMYQRQGKSIEWIQMRINTKIQRAAFTSALKAAMTETAQSHYGLATNEIYLGLWERTAKMLKEAMDLPKNANLRDHQPIAALYYQGLAEDGCARELGDRQELTWAEALYIIQDVAQFIGGQARAYSQRFGVDLATGKPLLRDKN